MPRQRKVLQQETEVYCNVNWSCLPEQQVVGVSETLLNLRLQEPTPTHCAVVILMLLMMTVGVDKCIRVEEEHKPNFSVAEKRQFGASFPTTFPQPLSGRKKYKKKPYRQRF